MQSKDPSRAGVDGGLDGGHAPVLPSRQGHGPPADGGGVSGGMETLVVNASPIWVAIATCASGLVCFRALPIIECPPPFLYSCPAACFGVAAVAGGSSTAGVIARAHTCAQAHMHQHGHACACAHAPAHPACAGREARERHHRPPQLHPAEDCHRGLGGVHLRERDGHGAVAVCVPGVDTGRCTVLEHCAHKASSSVYSGG